MKQSKKKQKICLRHSHQHWWPFWRLPVFDLLLELGVELFVSVAKKSKLSLLAVKDDHDEVWLRFKWKSERWFITRGGSRNHGREGGRGGWSYSNSHVWGGGWGRDIKIGLYHGVRMQDCANTVTSFFFSCVVKEEEGYGTFPLTPPLDPHLIVCNRCIVHTYLGLKDRT